jgi:hypothetical protein
MAMGAPRVWSGQSALVSGAGDYFIPVADNEPSRATYSFFVSAVAPAATPTDLLTITGAAGFRIRVRQFIISGTATAASNVIVNLVRRSAANTGGTATNPTLVSRDALLDNNGAQATVALYSANPSGLGTAVGTIDGGRLNLAPAANGSIDRLLIQHGWLNDKATTLNTATDILALNLGGLAWPAGGLLDIACTFSVEAQ